MTASTVDPMLLPKTMAALRFQDKVPLAAIVKTMAVIAELECIKAVMKAPMRTPRRIPLMPQSFIM